MALVPAISYPVTDASPMLPGVFTGRTEEAAWEATLKFFVRENGGAVLKAANPAYKDIPAGSKLKIIGQLVALLKNPPTVSNYLAHLVHKDISDRKWQYAIELATQAGLDGESVANIIAAVMKSAKQISK
ncbi:MAG: LexA repressor [Firmicutes bacterium]|nr:LexA repressor [Bacillota bacterium]